jgi:crossover junction endodeoxyribonuclease RuvC
MTGIVVGVDPGVAGGISIIWLATGQIAGVPMPVIKEKGKSRLDCLSIVNSLKVHSIRDAVRLVVIERVGSQPSDGHQSAFRFGFNAGVLHGIIQGLGLPLDDTVTPQRWQKAILGSFAAGESKAASIAFCKRRWPGLSLLPTPRCSKDSDGIADAACIAEFARRQVVGNGQLSEAEAL